MRALHCLPLLFASACVFGPIDNQLVSSTSEPISFFGMYSLPGAAIDLESSPSRSGPFERFASARSDTIPTRVEGVDLYSWSTVVEVPSWTGTGCAREVFVRARSSGLPLLTFEGDGLACLSRAISGGSSPVAAVGQCVSPRSPVVRLRSIQPTYAGDLTLRDQIEADAYACYTSIQGSLTIAMDPGAASIALPNLRVVTGDLSISYSVAGGGTSARVGVVELESLATVRGALELDVAAGPSDLISWDVGLRGLTTVGGDVQLVTTAFNTSLVGLDALTAVPGDLRVVGGVGDFFGGALAALTSVAGSVELSNRNTTYGFFRNLESIGGDLTLREAKLAPDSFEALRTVSGDLVLRDIELLVGGTQSHLSALTSVGGALIAQSTRLSDLLIGDHAGLRVSRLSVQQNASLQRLSADWIDVEDDGSVEITDNAPLTDCQARDFVDAIGWPGVATIAGNQGC